MKKITALVLALAMMLSICGAVAEGYPNGLVNLICPWAAGGSTDITARAIAQVAEQMFGSPVVVVNREGGGSTIGTQEVALNTPGDGQTILVAALNSISVLPHTMGLDYTPANFKNLGQVCVREVGILCTADKPWTNINDFIEDAKTKPEGHYFVACPQGGVQNIMFQMLADAAGISFTVYPVNNDNESVTALLGGVADICIPGSYDAAAGQIEAGQVKALAAFSTERIPALPETPTLMELGYDMSYYPWTCLMVPATTDDALVAEMEEAWAKVLQSEELAELLVKSKQVPKYMDGKTTHDVITKQYNDFGETIEKMGLSGK